MSNQMYFTGKDIKDIIIDVPTFRRMEINPILFSLVQTNRQQNVKVFLDTPLLKIRNNISEQEFANKKHVSKSDVSVSLGAFPLVSSVVYITQLLTTAEFKELSVDEFKEKYLSPLDNAINNNIFNYKLLLSEYVYPFGDPMSEDDDIQSYFDETTVFPLKNFYREIYGEDSYFGGLHF